MVKPYWKDKSTLLFRVIVLSIHSVFGDIVMRAKKCQVHDCDTISELSKFLSCVWSPINGMECPLSGSILPGGSEQ